MANFGFKSTLEFKIPVWFWFASPQMGVPIKCADSQTTTPVCFATSRSLRQVSLHHHGVQLFAAGVLVVPFAAPDDAESGAFIQGAGRAVAFLDFEKHGFQAMPRKMPEMGAQQIARKPAPAVLCATATERISASSAAVRDTINPMVDPPSLSR